ncbi:MAG: VOC family protein [Hyphomicrobiaceae bacterium]
MPSPMQNNAIDYIEFIVADIERAKAFYQAAFGWTFTDYGPEYASFSDGQLEGGFTTQGTPHPNGGPLVILYAKDLKTCQAAVEKADGKIKREIFDFPGGRRFHFTDPDGYELAVWSAT